MAGSSILLYIHSIDVRAATSRKADGNGPNGIFPLGLSQGHLPVTPIHTAHQTVKGEMDGLMGFGWGRFGEYALNYRGSQGHIGLRKIRFVSSQSEDLRLKWVILREKLKS